MCYLPGIDAEEKINWTPSGSLLECLVQSLIAWISRTPNLILERLVHIIFCVGFDDEIASLAETVNWY